MALSEKHRNTIYTEFAAIIGEEEAAALLAQFPSRDLDEPVTKEFVRAEIADVRTEIAELRTEVMSIKSDVREDISVQFRWIIGAWLTSSAIWATVAGLALTC